MAGIEIAVQGLWCFSEAPILRTLLPSMAITE